MEPGERSTPRLMFVLSAAYGELFSAMYMVTGCRFHTAFAMRDPWYSLNRTGLPGRSYHFENFDNLIAAIEQERPDLVCLFSGYLYVYEGTLAFDDLDRLVKYLRARRTKLVTSDPFIGLVSRLPVLDFQNPFEQIITAPLRLVAEVLFGPKFAHFLRMRSILDKVPHVYVVDPQENGVRAFPFYNPNICRPPSDRSALQHAEIAGLTVDVTAQPYWLFVLGKGEYDLGAKPRGAERFHAVLAAKLRETMEQGRRAVLIAPEPCIAALESDHTLRECSFVRYCDFHSYLAILLGAEYAFYWNIFSASLVARLLNRGSTFFFAGGHLADQYQQLFEKGMSCYYRNARLSYLYVDQRLERASLSGAALAQQQQLFDPLFANVGHLPSPEAMVRTLLNER
jgi:hypothetical protein